MIQKDDGNFRESQLPRSRWPSVTRDDHAVRSGENWIGEAELPDAGGDLGDLGDLLVTMEPRFPCVVHETIDVPAFQLVGRRGAVLLPPLNRDIDVTGSPGLCSQSVGLLSRSYGTSYTNRPVMLRHGRSPQRTTAQSTDKAAIGCPPCLIHLRPRPNEMLFALFW
jgi:hypothetical protein